MHSGLLTKGLFAAVESFAHLYEELVETRGVANGNFSVVQVCGCVIRGGLVFGAACGGCPSEAPSEARCLPQPSDCAGRLGPS